MPAWGGHLKVGGREGDRTPDLYLAKVALSQLSYTPIPVYNSTIFPAPFSGLMPALLSMQVFVRHHSALFRPGSCGLLHFFVW